MTPTETNAAFASISKLIAIVIKAYPQATHKQVAEYTLTAWREKRETLEDQVSKLLKRKASTAQKASLNGKQDQLTGLGAVEPVLKAMLDILQKQAAPSVVQPVKKAA